MMSLKISKGSLPEKVLIPSSKSYANRALILAALSEKPFTLFNLPNATDVAHLLNCFEKMGLEFDKRENSLKIKNSFPACETNDLELEVGDGGTTARFLAAMCLLGNKSYALKLGKRLKDRPWEEFISLVQSLGAKAQLTGDLLTLQGPLHLPPSLEVDCSKTTQFATAFQLIAANKPTEIKPIHLKSSVSYLKMTEKIIHDVRSSDSYNVPLDWSSASYPLAFAALNHKISFPGLKLDPYQADAKFSEILEKFKALSYPEHGSIVVGPFETSFDLIYDVSDALDLVPALAFFLAHVPGKHQLSGIKNLIHKESDRLSEVIKLLQTFGRDCSTNGYTLFINGSEKKIDKEVNLVMADDHRMVMAGTLFLLHHAGGTIYPSEAVNKSYPEFFELITCRNGL